jgi:biotin-dependent carboxylase-like uncharacterized protein
MSRTEQLLSVLMIPTFRVLTPGLFTTIQDLGRTGHQHVGVGVSGALDPLSLRVANALVRNPPATGALEIAYSGPTLLLEADSARLAFAGANADIEVLPNEKAPSGTRMANLRSFRMHRGEVVRIGGLSDAAVLYMAVEGGFALAPIMGSISTDVRSALGGWHGRPLAMGDQLPLHQTRASNSSECQLKGELNLRSPLRFRAILGPQSDYFSPAAIATFFQSEYTVGADSNRMAMRLIGDKLEHIGGSDIVSDGIAPGSVQVPGNGQPIVLLADRQTTGGYPKIATVISADLPALGRIRVGTKIAFQEVTIEEALQLRRKLVQEMDHLSERVVPLIFNDGEITARLLSCNLVSGAVDAQHGL